MGKPKQGAASPRDRVLATASELFYRRGFSAVGVDEIVSQSGVAKMTLYRHFPSKDELIAAYLERADEAFSMWFESALARATDPRAQLLAVFEALAELATSSVCLGCTFQGSAAEFPDARHPAHRIALAHKVRVRRRLSDLARQASLRHPDVLAGQLLLLMDGAWVAARMFGPDNPGVYVADAAEALIAAHATDARARLLH